MKLDLQDRRELYAQAFPEWPASWPHVVHEQGRQVLYAIWVIGQDYRNRTKYYGAYPKSYLERVMAMFPDARNVLQAFSGSLPAGPYLRCDAVQEAELKCSVYDLPTVVARRPFDLIMADPPYTSKDAEQYGTPMVDRRRAVAALAGVAQPGAYMAWLDTCWPMHNKTQWLTVGRILVQRSTNHRARVLTIFERTGS